jgi:hypothetical protein
MLMGNEDATIREDRGFGCFGFATALTGLSEVRHHSTVLQ